MPDTAHLLPATPDQRSAEILDAVRHAFADKGFDGTSMQDLARAAGMSVGNFYRYFPSKAAIVEGLIARDLQEIEAEFGAIVQSDDPRAALRAAIRHHIVSDHCSKDGRIMAEISAAALRKPEVGCIAQQMETRIGDYLTAVFARITGLSPEDCAHRFHAHAVFMIMLVKASASHPGQDEGQRSNLTDLILRTIDRTIDDIVAEASKG
jgi:AcrR family transcriptional regulator